MFTDAKIREVRKSLRSGVPEGEIRNELLRQGFTEEEIKQVFSPHTYDMRSWYLSFAIIFMLIGFWLLLTEKSLLFLLFSAAMFYQYYVQVKKRNE